MTAQQICIAILVLIVLSVIIWHMLKSIGKSTAPKYPLYIPPDEREKRRTKA